MKRKSGTQERNLYFSGVKVVFPRSPFDTQFILLNNLIKALKNGENAILESPTGTGKTLALLAGTLSYQQHRYKEICEEYREKNAKKAKVEIEYDLTSSMSLSGDEHEVIDLVQDPIIEEPLKPKIAVERQFNGKIIYASRTHSQLSQVAEELKKLPLSLIDGEEMRSQGLKLVMLGSKKTSCINQTALSSKNLEEACSEMILGGQNKSSCSCRYYNGSRFITPSLTDQLFANHSGSVTDLEDLKSFGRKKHVCPYFMSRHLLKGAHIVLCPYNYLLDASIRKATTLDRYLKDAIVIFDEAHNVESTARDASSLEASFQEIKGHVTAFQGYKSFGAPELYQHYSDLLVLMEGISKFCHLTNKVVLQKGPQLFKMLKETLHLTLEDVLVKKKQLKDIIAHGVSSEKTLKRKGRSKDHQEVDVMSNFLKNFLELFFMIAESMFMGNQNDFALCINKTQFNIWCLTAKQVFRQLMECKVRSIVLASGTLSPFSTLIEELGISFPHVMEASRPLKANSLMSIQQTFSECRRIRLTSTYKNLCGSGSSNNYMNALGESILKYLRHIPMGVLVFFPSFSFLNKCIDVWKAKRLILAMSKEKSIFSESLLTNKTRKTTLEGAYEDYCNLIATGKGALFFCVFRGRLSEGIDFKDDQCRGVISVGIPFAPMNDHKIKFKREYQDAIVAGSGQKWYVQQAWRAVNQALGRVLRHQNDHGVLVFLDARFSDTNNIKNLSKWIQKSALVASQQKDSTHVTDRLDKFFISQHLKSESNLQSVDDSNVIKITTTLKKEDKENNSGSSNGIRTYFGASKA